MNVCKITFASLFLVITCAVDPNYAYNPHPDFEEPGNLWDIDYNVPVEQRIIELTDEIYDTEITNRLSGTPLNTTPWVILFLAKDQIDCQRAMVHFKSMAWNQKGNIRFGWVSRDENELLSESFNVRQIP